METFAGLGRAEDKLNIKFFLPLVKGTKRFVVNRDGYSTIYVKINKGRSLNRNFSTGINVLSEVWDVEGQRVKEEGLRLFPEANETVNRPLAVMEDSLNKFYRAARKKDVVVTNTWASELVRSLTGKRKSTKVVYFAEFVEKFIDDVSRDRSPRLIRVRGEERKAAKSTIERYKLSFKRFKEYEASRKVNLRFINIDRHFRLDFLNWLGERYTNNNTLYEHVKNIRRFARIAEYDGYEVSPDVNSRDHFPTIRQKNIYEGKEIKETYLTEEEQEILLNLDLSKTKGLENGRDLFVILCQTGLRFSDLTDNVISQFHNETATLPVKKTGGDLVIPVLPLVKKIISKRTPHVLSKSALNRHIKNVCKMAEFDTPTIGYKLTEVDGVKRKEIKEFPRYSLMSSHTGRRSFATNSLNNGVPASLICQITGHSTESMLYKYLKITPKDSAEQFSAFYSRKKREL